jgi:hypothetical protein
MPGDYQRGYNDGQWAALPAEERQEISRRNLAAVIHLAFVIFVVPPLLAFLAVFFMAIPALIWNTPHIVGHFFEYCLHPSALFFLIGNFYQ